MTDEWSSSEKKIARRVFDAALHQELTEVLQTFKAMAERASDPEGMWSTEEFLSKSRWAIDSKYDYRYSQLDLVFGRLLREGRISEQDLSGLSESKMSVILRIAAF
ncbi:hypothetical protein [Paucibacter sp. DJ2R-2]|uniref:hypothetical protein n=1 Tax=Paucibacter sp. DJ2R-2 TaxID=2893558 RepID=UPI0021E4B834|nr:hypothetical protein [Paucibacter sp. DJ2R-2]MCV2422698.1 hypothetical protein [Paucibacter sp. DJ4R-1]MCV2441141.1 hypothetical protein [Paucibacter sp. DJ2R-2]